MKNDTNPLILAMETKQKEPLSKMLDIFRQMHQMLHDEMLQKSEPPVFGGRKDVHVITQQSHAG